MTSNVLLNPISPLRHVFPAAAGLIAFKGGGGSAPASQNITQTNLPEYAEPYFRRLLERSESLSLGEYQPFEGQRQAALPCCVCRCCHSVLAPSRGHCGACIAGDFEVGGRKACVRHGPRVPMRRPAPRRTAARRPPQQQGRPQARHGRARLQGRRALSNEPSLETLETAQNRHGCCCGRCNRC